MKKRILFGLGATSALVLLISLVIPIPNQAHADVPMLSNCGVGPSVVGTDTYGRITLGGGIIMQCTLSFDTPWLGANPVCILTSSDATVAVGATVTQTELQINTSTNFGGGDIMYHCSDY